MKGNYAIVATTVHELSKYIGTGEVILVNSTEWSSKGRVINDKSTILGIIILDVIQLLDRNGRTGWIWGKEHVNAVRNSKENIMKRQ